MTGVTPLTVRVFEVAAEAAWSALGLGIGFGLLPLFALPPLSNRSRGEGVLDSSAVLALTSCIASANEFIPSLVVGDEEVGLGVETLSVLLTAGFVTSLPPLVCSISKVLLLFSLSSSCDDEESVTLVVLIRLVGLGGPLSLRGGGVTLSTTVSDGPSSEGVKFLFSV